MNTRSKFAPGFRLSKFDVGVLVVGAAAAIAAGMIVWWIGFLIAYVTGHFFLFCNVFRISRPLELTWAGIFVALAAGSAAIDVPGWIVTVAASLCVTIAVVVIEMRKPTYHGIGWKRINPSLRGW
ncbi:MAG: hypothetical protein K8T25_21325 [Planctomycetia bacterium]|nr:hypothetical protein [Planctomycetia bacterium]